MTSTLFAFNIAATAYMVLGSIHEEARLKAAYGAEYDRYADSGVPFFVPTLTARSLENVGRPMGAIAITDGTGE